MTPELNRIYSGDFLATMRQWPDAFVHCAVTSPPYFGLRDYKVEGQIGLERSPQEFVEKMVEVFREVRRVLRDDGTLWLNIGDSYAGSLGAQGRQGSTGALATRSGASTRQIAAAQKRKSGTGSLAHLEGIKPKDLYGVPWMLAFALRADGWYLRQDIIWHKPNPMPESIRDRCTKSHEYLFLLSKSERYFYDREAIAEPCEFSEYKTPDGWDTSSGSGGHGSFHREGREQGYKGYVKKSGNKKRKAAADRGVPVQADGTTNGAGDGSVPWEGTTRNKRSVWTVTTRPCPEAKDHFATFPEDLIKPCILAGSMGGGHRA